MPGCLACAAGLDAERVRAGSPCATAGALCPKEHCTPTLHPTLHPTLSWGCGLAPGVLWVLVTFANIFCHLLLLVVSPCPLCPVSSVGFCFLLLWSFWSPTSPYAQAQTQLQNARSEHGVGAEKPQNHRMDLKDHLVPTPPSWAGIDDSDQ